MTRRRRRGDRGAAAVEFALVFPLLVLLVVGIAEFGRAYHLQTTISGAAREGVRVMALQNSPSGARDAVKAYSPGLNISDSQINVSVRLSDGSSASSCTTGARAVVTVSYPFTFITGLVGANSSLTLTGRGSMRCNG